MTNPLQGSDEETQERDECIARIEENDEGSNIVDMLGQQSWLIARLRESLSKQDSLESALREAQKDVERMDWIQQRRDAGHSVAFSKSLDALLEAARSVNHWDRDGNVRNSIDRARADTGEST